jgi:hypothetical protein
MPALNFQARFAHDVEWGHKRQTVRAPRKDGRPHCKVGDQLKLYTGMRSKACRLLYVATVTRIATVRIEAVEMFINGRRLPSAIYDRNCEQTDNEFAQADGFDSFTEMAAWFEKTHGLPFEGVLVEWGGPG